MVLLLFYAIFVVNICEISCRCTFERFNFEYPPVFTQKFKTGEVVLKPLDRQLHISEGGYITAYCDSNFSIPLFGRSESEGVSSVNVRCSKGNIYYEDIEGDEKMQEARDELVCYGSQPEFYSTYSENCDSYGTPMAYGFTVAGKQIILATFCYNFDVEEIVHIRYKSFERSFVLSDTRLAGAYLDTNNKVTLNIVGSNENRTEELNSLLHRRFNYLPDTNLYRFDNLVPVESLVKSFSFQWDHLEGPNSIPWWINLKDGNWKLFEELLEKEMLQHDYEIYTGVTHSYGIEEMRSSRDERIRQEHIRQREMERKRDEEARAEQRRREEEQRKREEEARAQAPLPSYKPNRTPYTSVPPRGFAQYNRTSNQYPPNYTGYNNNRFTRSAQIDNAFDDEIRYVSGSVVKSIPLYVWAYIKAPYGDSNSTVVLGINSPFIEVSKFPKLDFCHDTCPIWLEKLSASSQISSLGYMFCCRPEVARDYIPNLPKA